MEVEPGPFVQLNNQGVCGSLGLNEIDYVDFFCCTFYDSVFSKRHESRSNEGKGTC